MLTMPTIQIGNPITLVILVESDYWLIQGVSNKKRSDDCLGEYSSGGELKPDDGLATSNMKSPRKGPTRKRGDYGLRLSWGG